MTEYPEIDLGFEAKRNIETIAGRWFDLKARLEPQSAGENVGSRPAPGSRPPIDLHVSDLLHEIEHHARFHAQVLMDETDYEPQQPNITVPGMLFDVAERYAHFTELPGAMQTRSTTDASTILAFTDWAEEYERKTKKALEKPPNPRYMGDCPNGACEGDLYLKAGRESMVCRECGEETTLTDQRDFIVRCLERRLMTQSEIASMLVFLGHRVPYSTVRRWASGKHPKLAEVHDGLYRMQDALTLAERRSSKVVAHAG